MKLLEMVVFDRALNRQERLKVQRYMRAKWMNERLASRHRRFVHHLLVSFFSEWLPRYHNVSERVARRGSRT